MVDVEGQGRTLRFAPFSSQISPSFWTSLAALKIDSIQLSEETISDVQARYTVGTSVLDRRTNELVNLPSHLTFDGDSLQHDDKPATASANDRRRIGVRGDLKNFNTVEDFKKADKAKLLQDAGSRMLQAIMNADDPTAHLTTFLLLSFADLKKYKFIYWFAFPALLSQPSWQVSRQGWRGAEEELGAGALEKIGTQINEQQHALHGFFLVDRLSGKVAPIMRFNDVFANVAEADRVVGFVDPSSASDTPGWPLRNLLTLLACRFAVRTIGVLCWRQDGASNASGKSLFFNAQLDPSVAGDGAAAVSASLQYEGGRQLPLAPSAAPSQPSVVGWERSTSGKLAPRMADLGAMMDPKRLADQAVDLNLKLMRWRILPEIDLDKVRSTRCLLLGAGTLGCYVARTLLGWGVRTITLVDSSTVSFSNPVRQPLFAFEDCLDGGKPKAERAAAALQAVYPGVNARGVRLNVPMPGHPIPPSAEQQTGNELSTLEKLFDEHDVVYLLMDSRESRWLPTVMGAAKNKLVMNAALGFDTFLAMRHGAGPGPDHQPADERLGCYFCNDIVAPTDSLTDRTLDQMCTVTRPGLAAMASAATVEMMVSVLQHPRGILAPAFKKPVAGGEGRSVAGEAAAGLASTSILGHLPHQLRGSLFTFQNMLIHGPAYDRCTACSSTVVNAYLAEGFDMVKKACNDEGYLRSLTGLDSLYDATDDIEVEWSDDEEEGGKDDIDGDGELL